MRSSGTLSEIAFGREFCGDLATSAKREWLVTNGLGGFASATISGIQTRRYHALLVAALKPPVGRTVLLASLDESLDYDRTTYSLATTRWHDGTLAPDGYCYLERFHLEGAVPTWTYACSDVLLEKRVWMEQGANTTYVTYTLARASKAVSLRVQAMVNYRDFHGNTHAADWRMSIDGLSDGIHVRAYDAATSFTVRSDRAACEPAHEWYRNYDLAEERARGLDDSEDHLHAATFFVTLTQGETVTFTASTDPGASLDGAAARERQRVHEDYVLGAADDVPPWIARLTLAADQFIVRRPIESDPEALSVIAGYHWFGDWGRDTMIALPGLTLATKRAPIAAKILTTFSRYLDRGMLPNFFPDAGETPEYNDVDASLWFIEAVRQYIEATNDAMTLKQLFPVLQQIVRCYREGTRYNIHCDPEDGLISAGEHGVQLTWMDAKVGDWVVTPRMGKPIEVNALWLNALHTVAQLGRMLETPDRECDDLESKVRANFARFWNPERGYCFDVLDGPNGDDASLRPNQIFAVALPQTALSPQQQRSVVDVCARAFVTTHGLRSLASDDAQFRPYYGGAQLDRDGEYHQGTVWTWLLGPYALAHFRVYGDRAAAQNILQTAGTQVAGYGVGTLGEITDAAEPFRPNGCIAQAWSVAEILRAWYALRVAQAP
ncbi:MAG: glycogen debranching enzyme family protein [Candidatus Eremiobacteraeota bacterium]|nr:glycogen debranching enzyme family protein [Candidatus Eremiobacteraeota bacterium]